MYNNCFGHKNRAGLQLPMYYDRMFPFAKWDISEWGSKYDSKNN